MTQVDRTREHLIETYRKKAKHYDTTSRLYPCPATPSGRNASGRYMRSASARVTPWSTWPAAQA